MTLACSAPPHLNSRRLGFDEPIRFEWEKLKSFSLQSFSLLVLSIINQLDVLMFDSNSKILCPGAALKIAFHLSAMEAFRVIAALD